MSVATARMRATSSSTVDPFLSWNLVYPSSRYLRTEATISAGVPCETVVEQSEDAARKIVEVADRMQCDAIFMASHRKSALEKLFVGSATQKVLSLTNVPVMVFR